MPSDDLTAVVADQAASRVSPERAAMLQRLDALSDEEHQDIGQSDPKLASVAAVADPSKAGVKPDSPGALRETRLAVQGGLTDAAQAVADLADDAVSFVFDKALQWQTGHDYSGWNGDRNVQFRKPDENQTTLGKMGRGLTQFLVPYAGAVKALNVAKLFKSSIAVKGTVAGAAAAAAAFDPHEKRLSNLIMEMTDENPAFGKELFGFLAADPQDGRAEGRFKNAIEMSMFGGAVEGVLKLAKTTKAYFTAQGKNAADEITKAAAETPTGKLAQGAAGIGSDLANATPTPARRRPLTDLIDEAKQLATRPASAEDRIATVRQRLLKEEAAGVSDGNFVVRDRVAAARAARSADESIVARYDPADGSVIVSSKADTKAPGVPLDERVKESLGKAPEARTAEDIDILRTYQELQEVVLGGAPKIEPQRATGKGAAAVTDEARAAIRKQGEEIVAAVRINQERLAGETVESMKHAERSAVSGSAQAVESASVLLAAAAKRGQELRHLALSQGTQQAVGGGLLLAASGSALAADGSNISSDDMLDYLVLGGAALLGGRYIKNALGRSAKAIRPRDIADRAVHPEVKSMARSIADSVAPRPVSVELKHKPRISGEKVSQMVDAFRAGKTADLAKALDESDFNLAKIDTAEDVKELVDGFSAVFEREINQAKHGTKTFEEIQQWAREVGAGKETLDWLAQSTDNLAGRVLAHRTLMAASAEKVRSLADVVLGAHAGGRIDEEAILALRKHVALHASIQAQMKGVQTEIARALSQFRIKASSVDLAINERGALIDALGGQKVNLEFAQKLAQITDPEKLNAATRRGALARTHDAVYEMWVNGLLSNPITHAVNTVGNGLVAIGSVAEKLGAALKGAVLRGGKDSVEMGEVTAQLWGMLEGLKDAVHITAHGQKAVKNAAGQAFQLDFAGAKETLAGSSNEFGTGFRAFAADAPILDNAALGTMDRRTHAISAKSFDLDPRSWTGKTADVLGELVRLPGRALVTADEIFKTIHYRGELKAQAYRKASGRGLEGEALWTEIARLIDDPSPELSGLALKAAREGTFTTPLGEAGRRIQGFFSLPGLNYVVPFVRTPVNIMRYVGERTPALNLISDNIRADLAAGGARGDIAISKTAMGASLYALGAYLASQGIIVGGGLEKDKSAEQLGQVQSYSLHLGDTYYSFNRLDPIGMFLGLAADIANISGHVGSVETDKLATAALVSINRNLMSKSYLSGLVDLMDTISDTSVNKWQKWVNRQTGTLVPFSGAMGQLRKEVDPEVKEIWTMTDAVLARIPGLSNRVKPHVNLFGEDVVYQGGLGPDIASPVATMKESVELAAKEIARLNVDLRHPLKEIGGAAGRPGVSLDDNQYYRLMKLLGNETKVNGKGFKDAMNEMVQSDFFQRLPEDPNQTTYDQSKEKVIRLMYENYKRAATMALLAEDEGLKKRFLQNLRNSGNALIGLPVEPVN